MLDRNEFLKQLERWGELFHQEAIILFDKGVGPDRLMATAITIADARLASEMNAARGRVLTVPGATLRRTPN